MGYIDLNVYMFVNEYFKKDKLSKRSSSLTPHSCQRTWALCGIFNQVQDSPKTDKRMCYTALHSMTYTAVITLMREEEMIKKL